MKRRDFVALVGAAVVAWPLAVADQQATRVKQVGVLLPYVERDEQSQARGTAFSAVLRERGWVDGRSVEIQFRYAEGRCDRLPVLAADLVQRNVDGPNRPIWRERQPRPFQ